MYENVPIRPQDRLPGLLRRGPIPPRPEGQDILGAESGDADPPPRTAPRRRRGGRPGRPARAGRGRSETSYGDPLEAALAWQRAGAEWIHLVDLDAAFGRGSNANFSPPW